MALLFPLLLFALQGTAPDQDPLAGVSEQLSQASARYWFAIESFDDVNTLNEGLSLVEEALEALETAPPTAKREELRATAEQLRSDLREQHIMGRDTIEGVFPLYRHLALGLEADVLVDDPWLLSATKAATVISSVAGNTWSKHAQLDAVLRIRVRHDGNTPKENGALVQP